MECVSCGLDVDPERAEFLVECGRRVTCMGCSMEQPKVCFMDYSEGKTAPTLVIVGTNPESIRLATNAFRRRR